LIVTPILGEKVIRIFAGESVWARTRWTEDYEIGDVYRPHARLQSSLAKKVSSGNFGCDPCTNNNETRTVC